MAKTKIEWTAAPDGSPGFTFNPWWGCQKVSPGCDFCYAEAMDRRTGGAHWGPHVERRRTTESYWRQPRKWNSEARKVGIRRKVFCASIADVFDNAVPSGWRADLWALIRQTPHLDWLLLTKRPQNIGKMLPPHWGAGWPNVWLGTTVENQTEAERRIWPLLSVPAAVHFLSCEPLLSRLNLRKVRHEPPGCGGTVFLDVLAGIGGSIGGSFEVPKVDWVIAGGESGPGARPVHPDWARFLRDQCTATDVPFFFKQWGEWHPTDQEGAGEHVARERRYLDRDGNPCHGSLSNAVVHRIGKGKAGHLLDGREWHEFPKPGMAAQEAA